jgi:hypothetical protein
LADGYAQTNQRQRAIEATEKSVTLAEKDASLSASAKQDLQAAAKRRLEQLNK